MPERLATPPGSTSPTLFEQWCGFFYVPQEPDKWKCCETGPTVFRPCPIRLESLTICRCHYKGSTLSVGPAGVWTHDLPLSRPTLLPTELVPFWQLDQVSDKFKLFIQLFSWLLFSRSMDHVSNQNETCWEAFDSCLKNVEFAQAQSL